MFDNFEAITLHDALMQRPDILENLQLDTVAHTQRFIEVFKARYDIYEINGDIDLFKRIVENKFVIVKKWYVDMINAYDKNLDYEDGITYTTHRTEGNISGSNSDNEQFDFPNSVTSQQYKTGKQTSSGSDTSNTTVDSKMTGGVNVIDQRKKYMDYLRNLYEEFAEEFKYCFVMVYK